MRRKRYSSSRVFTHRGARGAIPSAICCVIRRQSAEANNLCSSPRSVYSGSHYYAPPKNFNPVSASAPTMCTTLILLILYVNTIFRNLERSLTKFCRVVCHDNARQLTTGLLNIIFSFSRYILPKKKYFSATLTFMERTNYLYKKSPLVICFVLL